MSAEPSPVWVEYDLASDYYGVREGTLRVWVKRNLVPHRIHNGRRQVDLKAVKQRLGQLREWQDKRRPTAA